jgi:hypothetical protein
MKKPRVEASGEKQRYRRGRESHGGIKIKEQ